MKKLLLTLLICLTTVALHAESEIVAFHLNSENGLPDNNIQRIHQDSLGYIWLFGRYNTFRYDGYDFKTFSKEEKSDQHMSKIPRGDVAGSEFHDNMNNKVKLLPNGDLTYTDGKSGESYTFNVVETRMFQLTQRMKCTVITDRRGLIWVSTNGCGLRIFNPQTKSLQVITAEDPRRLIASDRIVSMIEDNDGNIWVSCDYYGVTCLKVRQRNYEVIDIKDTGQGQSAEVRLLHRLDDGRILIAGKSGNVCLSEDELKTITPIRTDGHNYISGCLDAEGNLWLGARSEGLYINGKHYGSKRIDCILKDQQGRMWICGLKSPLKMVSLDNGQYAEQSFMQDIEGLDPRCMLQDHRGDIWLGTKQGLFVFTPDSLLANPNCYHKVLPHRVMCLYESNEQFIWVGTSGMGAFYADGKNHRANSFEQFSTRDGLANNIVQLISETPQQHLCIGTEDGLSFFDPTKRQIHNLFFSDSRLRNYFIERSVVRLHDGRIAFGTMDGIVVTHEVTPEPKQLYPLQITEIAVNGVVSDSTDYNALPYDQNSLTFSFSNLNFGEQRHTNYQCLLDGYDREWVNLGNHHSTTYKKLSPGEYTLHVRSTTLSGEVNGECQLQFRITPPWWRTWWAYLIYIITAFVTGYSLYRQLRRLNALRQAVAVEKQLTEYKLKFFTNISHEFRTPLTLIQGSMDKLKRLPDAPSSVRAPLSNMQRNVDRMLRLINQLLEFRRMQNNKLSLALEETDIVSFVYNLCQGFHDTAEQKRISLSFIPSVKSYTTFIDRGFIDKAVYNLLSNAFKYTPSGGSVTVRVKSAANATLISVEDTGVGVPLEMREKIFDRFQRGQIGRDSLGIGLDLTAELIRTHHGTIRCEENPAGGSIFTIELPTDKEVYCDKDFISENAPHKDEQSDERQGFTELVREAMPEPMNGHRILVVDDDADIAAFLKQELGRYFQVETENNGEEALSALLSQSSSFDLVITDAMMPRMNGFELIRQLRKNELTRHLPVIMLTSLDAEEQQMKGLEVGADAYITKPFSMPLLVMQVRNLLQRSSDLKKATTRSHTSDDAADDTTKTRKALAAAQVIVDERDQKLLTQLAIWVDSHLASPELSVDKFAEDMGYGRTNFYQKLKTLIGQTPNEYIKERRLQKAYELLADERVTVAEAAYQVGMATPQYLSTTFKKRFGITPSQYQKGEKGEKTGK